MRNLWLGSQPSSSIGGSGGGALQKQNTRLARFADIFHLCRQISQLIEYSFSSNITPFVFESPQLDSPTKWHNVVLRSSGCVRSMLMYDNRSIVCLFLRTFYFLPSHWRDNDRPDEHTHSFNFLLFSPHFHANEEIESSVFCFAMLFRSFCAVSSVSTGPSQM